MSSAHASAHAPSIRLGHPDIDPAAPAHTRGIREGNQPGSYERSPGHLAGGRSDARRSTGIDPAARNPVDARMPNLSPP